MTYTVTLDEDGRFHEITCKGESKPYFNGFQIATFIIFDVIAENTDEAIGFAKGLFARKEISA